MEEGRVTAVSLFRREKIGFRGSILPSDVSRTLVRIIFLAYRAIENVYDVPQNHSVVGKRMVVAVLTSLSQFVYIITQIVVDP